VAVADSPLQGLILGELVRHADRSVKIRELIKVTHGVAPDVIRAVNHLKTEGLILVTRENGVTRVSLSDSDRNCR
jgi:DNA-binding transcriptional regulator PaaX